MEHDARGGLICVGRARLVSRERGKRARHDLRTSGKDAGTSQRSFARPTIIRACHDHLPSEEEARARAAAEQEEYERELLQLRWEVKKLKLEHELWCLEEKYSPEQPRVPAGSGRAGVGATLLVRRSRR